MIQFQVIYTIFILLKLVFLPVAVQKQKSTCLEGRALQLKLASSTTGIN